jgi:antitoxin HicB
LGKENVSSREYRYAVLFEPAEEGGCVVTCPSLPGLVAEGDTLEEARAMAADAVRGDLEALAKDGLPLPPEDVHPTEEAVKETIAVVNREGVNGLPVLPPRQLIRALRRAGFALHRVHGGQQSSLSSIPGQAGHRAPADFRQMPTGLAREGTGCLQIPCK